MENKPFTKVSAIHASNFGIEGDSRELYSMIDVLQAHSEWKQPDRKWTIETYYHIAFLWIGKEDELRKRVEVMKKEMQGINPNL